MKHSVVAAALLLAVAPALRTNSPAAPRKQAPAKSPNGQKAKLPPRKREPCYSKELKNKLTLTDDQYQKVLA